MSWIVSILIIMAGLYAATRFRLTLFTWTAFFGIALLVLSVAGLVPWLFAIFLWPALIFMALLNVP